ncbi:zinc-binding dehydrogenase [Streptomyces sp. NBC_00568]|uniref:zinc-binding dehydrogenase n=1 Tax=Streptomyces sp. NBC_00568 TaxID=2975779 RepID=UPI00225A52E8|nr:zinc-binding dehydrogenase [Streptomyces sp. NBC_00568]MCX4993491.1 zinc-binding dehydrogenase [Streptomyces sp. NBC_00568]
MYAIRQHAFGAPDKLVYEEVDPPSLGPGEVRLAVTAAGVHLMDTVLRAGREMGMALPRLPMTPGREAAGVVDAVGAGVDAGWLGERVVAYLGHERNGGYATHAVTSADSLHRIPDGLDDNAAVTMIGTGRTAIGILEQATLSAKDVVVVTAAAGGLGTLLVQAARGAGAVVVGLAGGGQKLDVVREQGANGAVDYTLPGWEELLREALGGVPSTVVLDGVGGRLGRTAAESLGDGGRHLYFGWASDEGRFTSFSPQELEKYGITSQLAVGPSLFGLPGGIRRLEETALQWAAAGRLSPVVQSFPLACADEAHHALETRATVGKVVLRPGTDGRP